MVEALHSIEELRRMASPFPFNATLQEWKAKGGKVLGYTCIYVPEEIIHAAGMVSFRISGDNQEIDLTRAESYLYINSCSLARGCLQLGLEGKYDFLDGFVLGETCDGVRRLFDVWEGYLSTPFMYAYGVPRKFTEEAYGLMAWETRELKRVIEEHFQVQIPDEALRESIATYNHTRRMLRRLYDYRKLDAPPITGAETLEVLKAAVRLPRDLYNRQLEKVLDELASTSRKIEGRVRLMINGSVLHNSEFVEGIESVGGIVVTDELCTGTRYFWDEVSTEGEPLEALARYYLGRPPCARFVPSTKRFEHVFNMVKEFRVDGIINQIIRYCVPYGHDEPVLREKLMEDDIPVLELDLEYCMGNTGQIRTRAEAFIEMLLNRREESGVRG